MSGFFQNDSSDCGRRRRRHHRRRRPRGPTGATGATGATGPTGAASASLANASLYSTATAAVASLAAVPFASASAVNGITLPNPSTATIVTSGNYQVDFSGTFGTASQLTLYRNGVAVPGATFGAGANQLTSGSILLALTAGDALTVVNTSGASASLVSLGAAGSTTATLSVQQLP